MKTSFQYQHVPLQSEEEFVNRSTAEIEQVIQDAIEAGGECVLGLSGGSTPGPVYEELGKLVAVQWDKVTVFLVDERCVPADSGDSNQNLVRKALLRSARVGNAIFPDTALPIEECIDDYEKRLPHTVDVVILGMGEDGHIASLFPHDELALNEKGKLVIHTTTDTFAVRDRITVTIPVLSSARSILFLLRGEGKRKIFEGMMNADFDPVRYPAHALLETGKTTWITVW